MKTLCLFGGGKDSAMALLHELDQGHQCIALIVASNAHAQLSDGPEADVAVVRAVAEQIFHVKATVCNIPDRDFKSELVRSVEDLIAKESLDRVVTGDLYHPDGIIHDLRQQLGGKYPNVSFFSIGERYIQRDGFDTEQYLGELLQRLDLKITSIRLPDFNDIEKVFLGQSLDRDHLDLLKTKGIDPLGEDGEYQSLVISNKEGLNRLEILNSMTQTEKGRDTKNYDYRTLEITNWRIVSA